MIEAIQSGLFERLADNHAGPQYLYNHVDTFIPGTTPVYYSGPYWDEEELTSAVECLLTGKWVSAGEHVHKFETAFSKRFNQQHSVMVNSGSSANLVMIGALKSVFEWASGDEIILSPVGFPTTIAPVVQNDLKPVFVDIEFDTLNFDIDAIVSKISENTRAIFISPVLGNSPDFDKLTAISDEHGIQLILDNCDSLGSQWKGRYLNEYAVASSCSFYPAHHMTTGEGGMVSSNNKDIVDVARSLAWWGRDCYCVGAANLLSCGTCGHRFDTWLKDYQGVVDHKYIFSHMGYNLKPLDLQGAIGIAQLKKFGEIHRKRRASKHTLGQLIEDNVPDARVPVELEGGTASWFGTPVVCKDSTVKNSLVEHLEANRIQTRNYFAGNILVHPGYRHLGDWHEFPQANSVLERVFFIGASPHYGDPIFNYVQEVLQDWCRPS